MPIAEAGLQPEDQKVAESIGLHASFKGFELHLISFFSGGRRIKGK